MSEPLRIARIISSLTVGGVQNMLLGTLPLFDPARHQIRVACTYRLGELGERLVAAGVPCDVVPVSGRLNPLALRPLVRWLREHRIQVVHTHMYASNITGVAAARWAGVPVIISHIHATHEWKSPMRARVDRWMDRWRDASIAVSGAVRDACFAAWGVPDTGKLLVLHNAPRPMARQPEAAARLRAELGIAPGAIVLGSITRLAPVKGLDMMLRGAAPVLARRPEARLVLVGRGREREALEALARELGIAPQVLFTGERVDVEAFHELFDVFLLTSRTEGCPNVIMESMGYAKPIIATRVGGVPELIRDGETGLLVADRDHGALTAALEALLADPARARALGDAAARFIAGFSREAYVARLGALYEELAARKGLANAQRHSQPNT